MPERKNPVGALGEGPDITFRQVEAFLAAASTSSMAAAASHLHVTPSALSRLIAELERRLGEPLFVRRSQGVALTAAGEVFLPSARKVAAAYAAAVFAAGEASQDRLRLAGSHEILPLVLPRLLQEMPPAHRDAHLVFNEFSSRQVEIEVAEGRATIGLCMRASTSGLDQALEAQALLMAPIGLLASAHTRLPSAALSLSDLADLRFARLADEMPLPQALADAGLTLPAYQDSRVVSNSMPALLSVVLAGEVVTLVSAVAASMPPASGMQFAPLPGLVPPLYLCMLHRRQDAVESWKHAVMKAVLSAAWHPAVRACN